MQLSLPADSLPLKDMFQRLFAAESSPARVRAAEPLGFDPALWRELLALEIPFMRLSAEAGGGGLGLFDTCLLMEEAGRRLATVPLAESIVALRILGEVGGDTAHTWIDRIRDGGTVLTLALHPTTDGKPQLVPGAAAAHAILTFDGHTLAIEEPATPLPSLPMLSGTATAAFTPGQGTRHPLASNADAPAIWAAGIFRVPPN